jgi:pSer/pThr/pTyr-binding forkhead associated (FHA) protein
MDVSLVMFKADGTRRDFPVKGDRLVIGRKNTCDLRIPLTSVSRQHCEIRVADDQIRVRDLGSSNGTFHNDTRVQEAELAAGDELVIGPVVFTVVVDGEPAEIEPVRTVLEVDASGTAANASDASRMSDRSKGSSSGTKGGTSSGSQSARPPKPSSAASTNGRTDSETLDTDDPIAALEAMAEADDVDFDEIQILEEDEKA